MSEQSVKLLGSRSALRDLTRRSVLGGMAAAGVAVLAACGQDGKKMASNIAPDGKLESKLNVYTWGDYDDPGLLKEFRQEYDLLLQVDSFNSNEELMAKLAASRGTSGYDVVVPSGTFVPQMAEHQLLQKLDHSLLPNLRTMDPAFLGQEWDPDNDYAVCKCWGVTGFLYDNTVIKSKPASWRDFIDVAKGEASGNVGLLEDPSEVSVIGLSALGYEINTTDESELKKVEKLLLDELAPHVKAYSGSATTPMSQGGFSLIQGYNGDARQGILEDDDPDRWTFVFPEVSLNMWMDTWAIATGSPHPDAAHKFIDWIIAPDQAQAETEYIGYSTGSKIFLDESIEKKFEYPELIFPTSEILDRAVTQQVNEAQQFRVDMFTKVQARSAA